ncbi:MULTISPECIES: SLAP domain-containing protein [unclassified Lactobacillus]|uniref:SLAP domain-containing protein n=1 Tax=unclassified Lactobacillus TaxID=2620435 RepID=UPI0022405C98|nr:MULTISPECIES: SLAP domain-containing protein [unclassified Lactobacillus]
MKSKKITLVFLIGLFFLLVSPKKVNAASNTLKLNHNSYIYNSKGKRVGKTVIKKNKKINPVKKVEKVNKEKRYFIFINKIGVGVFDKQSLYWLPYKKIKNNYYYQIGENKYIKCANVETIGKSYVYTSEARIKIKLSNYAYNDKDKKTNYKVKENKTYIVDRKRIFSHDILSSYRIKGTNYWINQGFVEDNPRQLLLSADISKTPYAKFSVSKTTPIYDIQGKPEQGLMVSPGPSPVYTTKKQLYIWNPIDNQGELYYQVLNEEIYVKKSNGDTDYLLIKEGYIKASSGKIVAGSELSPSNTPEQAKAAYEASLAK